MKYYIFIIFIAGTADSSPAPKPRKILDPALYLVPHPPLIATSEEKQQENTWVIPLVSASSLKSVNGNKPGIPVITSSDGEPIKEVNVQSLGTGIMFQGMKVEAFLKPYQTTSEDSEIFKQKIPEMPTDGQKDDQNVLEKENNDKKPEKEKEANNKYDPERPEASASTVEERIPTAEELKTAETFWTSPNYGYAGSNYGRYASGYLGYGNAYGGYSSRPAWTGGWGNGKWGHYGSG